MRSTFGQLIGKIAASHWWDIERVASEFYTVEIGAPVNCPDEWTVDALKLACLLRLADAAHLDARRAPGF
ncbi:HD domain-containing protein [Nonomuraea composti]|uniref:HD domain-containing protein n=1 Tax=Nonomuraea composti TaxID=2720023 RepID=UPI003D184F3D